jgi:GMP synthase (glutamine-hydrolysing)
VRSLPGGAQLLCSNPHSSVQGAIVPLGRSSVWAVQYHPEFDLRHLSGLYRLYAHDMIEQGFFEDEADASAYKFDIDALAECPDDTTRRWQLGIDDDVIDDRIRRAEIINWIDSSILG